MGDWIWLFVEVFVGLARGRGRGLVVLVLVWVGGWRCWWGQWCWFVRGDGYVVLFCLFGLVEQVVGLFDQVVVVGIVDGWVEARYVEAGCDVYGVGVFGYRGADVFGYLGGFVEGGGWEQEHELFVVVVGYCVVGLQVLFQYGCYLVQHGVVGGVVVGVVDFFEVVYVEHYDA